MPSGTKPSAHTQRSAELLKHLRKRLIPVNQHGEKSQDIVQKACSASDPSGIPYKVYKRCPMLLQGYGNCCEGYGQKVSFQHPGKEQRGVSSEQFLS